jgi:hypothetical protein
MTAFMPDVLTFIISYLQLKEFLGENEESLGAITESVLETVDANLRWLEKYGGDISNWLAGSSEDAASYLSFSSTISIIIILSGYLITNY